MEIARRCSLTLKLGEARLPQYPVPAGVSTEEFLRAEAARGLTQRFGGVAAAEPPGHRARLRERARRHLPDGLRRLLPHRRGLHPLGARATACRSARGAARAPARSSPTACGITDLDPIRYDLLFERFLNPERVSMPDFDIDFCMDGRDRVIDYVAQKYGRERVSQIITYGTMAAKAVVRDVGRVLGMTYGYVDRIAKLIPFELGITLDDGAREGAGAQAALRDRG